MLLVIRYWPLPACALACSAIWAVIRAAMRVPPRLTLAEAIFAGYLGALLYLVFLLPVAPRPEEAGSLWAAVNLIPGRTIARIVSEVRGQITWQLIGNVAMFVPLGFLLPLLASRCRRFVATAVVGLSASIGIETVQLAMLVSHVSRRSVDVDDVILNVAGVCLGYVMWRAALPRRDTAALDAV